AGRPDRVGDVVLASLGAVAQLPCVVAPPAVHDPLVELPWRGRRRPGYGAGVVPGAHLVPGRRCRLAHRRETGCDVRAVTEPASAVLAPAPEGSVGADRTGVDVSGRHLGPRAATGDGRRHRPVHGRAVSERSEGVVAPAAELAADEDA